MERLTFNELQIVLLTASAESQSDVGHFVCVFPIQSFVISSSAQFSANKVPSRCLLVILLRPESGATSRDTEMGVRFEMGFWPSTQGSKAQRLCGEIETTIFTLSF